MLFNKISLFLAELETQEQEEAGKLASETEKEVTTTSPLKESEPVLQAPTEKEEDKADMPEKDPETINVSEENVIEPSSVKVYKNQ